MRIRSAMRIIGSVVLSLVGLAAWSAFAAQHPSTDQEPRPSGVSARAPNVQAYEPAGNKAGIDSSYILGPGDQITVRAVDVEQITDKPIPVDLNGDIRLPMAGRLRVSGLTVPQVEADITKRLKTYVLHPDVSVSIAEFRSQPVSVIGAVKTPGVQQVQGRKTLVEMLALAGGLDTTAGSTLKITRRLEWGRIPLAAAADDPTGRFSVAEVNLKSILRANNPEENILVKPYDVISVPRADSIYVIGQVQKGGSFLLNERDDVTVLQALSMAGGLDRAAKPQEAKILRRLPEASERKEIAVNLKKILDGKTPDVLMKPEDILFVPSSVSKRASLRALEAAVQMATGVAVWRVP